MKMCPQCRIAYTDDSLQFCLQDGTPLQPASETPPPASGDWSDSPTLVTPRPADKIRVDIQQPTTPPAGTNQFESRMTEPASIEPATPPKKSNTGTIVALTALLTLLAAGAGAFGVFYYLRNGKTETAQNTNVKIINVAQTPTVKPTANANAANANLANANAANANVSPSATATPKPALRPEQISDIEDGVADTIESWRQSTDNADIDAHIGNYAETVDYYNAGRVGVARVRADRQRAFDTYQTIDVSISNIKIKPDETGDKAIAVLDKEWRFENEEKSSSGKVQQQLQFVKTSGKWRISSEKDLKVYYIDK